MHLSHGITTYLLLASTVQYKDSYTHKLNQGYGIYVMLRTQKPPRGQAICSVKYPIYECAFIDLYCCNTYLPMLREPQPVRP